MKKLFKGYYSLNDAEFKDLWKNATFIFDTNVLLSLYRYQSQTRDELLKIMSNLKTRIWIPYHVGLEFQRNRLTVIEEQNKRFYDVKNIIEKSINALTNDLQKLELDKRHSHINPKNL